MFQARSVYDYEVCGEDSYRQCQFVYEICGECRVGVYAKDEPFDTMCFGSLSDEQINMFDYDLQDPKMVSLMRSVAAMSATPTSILR